MMRSGRLVKQAEQLNERANFYVGDDKTPEAFERLFCKGLDVLMKVRTIYISLSHSLARSSFDSQ
jgi:hypothetical protein